MLHKKKKMFERKKFGREKKQSNLCTKLSRNIQEKVEEMIRWIKCV